MTDRSDNRKTSQGDLTKATGLLGLLGLLVRERHFVIASLILGVSTVSWTAAVEWYGIVTQRLPVAWPEKPVKVEVDDELRMLSLATTFGPYVRMHDGEFFKDPKTGKPKLDGVPDGEIVFEKDQVKELGIISTEQRRLERRSPWYLARVYRDSRPDRAFQTWQINVTYYTGGVDRVPHVSEVCLQAGGAEILGQTSVNFNIPNAPLPWNKPFKCKRTLYRRMGQTGKRVDYYMFCYNGRPMADWKMVRSAVANPFVRYSYFAKIQFTPWNEVDDIEQADKAAEEFLSYALPAILQTLPTEEDVKKQGLQENN